MNKVALVTGASSGIGLATARQLATAGYAVLAAGRNKDHLELLRRENSAIQVWAGDLRPPESCEELVSSCIDVFGRLDLLVNNAGVIWVADAENTTDEIWVNTIAVNLSAVFYLSRSAIPHIRKSRGVILNVASDWGLAGGRNAVAYCASKGGVVLMTKAMALDHAHEGVRINAICPGDVETPMLYGEGAARGIDAAETVRKASAQSLTGRITSADEVAQLIVFLASDAAAQITGAAIPIDGGNGA